MLFEPGESGVGHGLGDEDEDLVPFVLVRHGYLTAPDVIPCTTYFSIRM